MKSGTDTTCVISNTATVTVVSAVVAVDVGYITEYNFQIYFTLNFIVLYGLPISSTTFTICLT